MNIQEITHKDESGAESFKFTQRGYMWLNPETLEWNYCNPAFNLRSIADIKRIAELEDYNLGLANESCKQQSKIIKLQQELNKAKAKIKNQETELTNLNAALKEKASD